MWLNGRLEFHCLHDSHRKFISPLMRKWIYMDLWSNYCHNNRNYINITCFPLILVYTEHLCYKSKTLIYKTHPLSFYKTLSHHWLIYFLNIKNVEHWSTAVNYKLHCRKQSERTKKALQINHKAHAHHKDISTFIAL